MRRVAIACSLETSSASSGRRCLRPKGIAILAPIVRRRHEETQDDESQVVVGFRAAYVFDVEHTDGAPLPQTAEVIGDPGEHTAALKRAIAAHGISVEYGDDLRTNRPTLRQV
jgi:hypothetical protein